MKPEWGADEISMRDNILGEGLRDPFKLNVRRVVLLQMERQMKR